MSSLVKLKKAAETLHDSTPYESIRQHLYSQLKDSRVHHIEWMLVTSKEICYKKDVDDYIWSIRFEDFGFPPLTYAKQLKYNGIYLVALCLHLDFVKLIPGYTYSLPQRDEDDHEWMVLGCYTSSKNKEGGLVPYMLLGFFLGWTGAHNFYAGQKRKGLIKLVASCTLIGIPFMMFWTFFELLDAYDHKRIPEDE